MATPIGVNYNVQTADGHVQMRVEKEAVSLYQLVKATGMTGNACVYLVKNARGLVLGSIKPKLVRNSNTLIVKFL